MREDRGGGLEHSDCDVDADKTGNRAERRTQVALVGGASVVMGATVGVLMGSTVVLRKGLVVLVLVCQAAGLGMRVRVLAQLRRFSLDAEASNRAQHARREGAPEREQHCE